MLDERTEEYLLSLLNDSLRQIGVQFDGTIVARLDPIVNGLRANTTVLERSGTCLQAVSVAYPSRCKGH